MSSGPDQVQTTTNQNTGQFTRGTVRTDPNAALSTGFQHAADESFRNATGNNALQNQALAGIANRGLGGSPVTSSAQDLATRTLQGDFLDPANNPAFNRLADLTRTRLSSEFAGSGRNLGASLPARADELGNIAARLYDSERGRQVATSAQAPGLAGVDFTNLNAALGASQFPLDQLIGRLGQLSPVGGRTVTTNMDQTGSIRGTASQPVFNNRGAGALGGALAGAQLGSIIPGVGTGIGALGGGLLGLF